MFKDFVKSIFVGAGGIAPGLSGGTLAIILGMYERMVGAVGNILKKPAESIKTLIPIGAGVIVGIVAFGTVQKFLLARYLMQIMFCFMGLIIGSLPFLFREANAKDPITRENSVSRIIPFLITLAIGLILTILETREINVDPVVIAMSPVVFGRLMLVGVLIAASLVIPGVSGTVLLVMIGQYGLVLNAIADLRNILKLPMASPEMIQGILDNLLVLIPLGLGTAIGGIAISYIVHLLLQHWHGQAYAGILGFVIGSIPALYPRGSDVGLNSQTLISVILLLGGIILAYWFSNLGNRNANGAA